MYYIYDDFGPVDSKGWAAFIFAAVIDICLVTALLLSTIFAEMNEPIILYLVVILSISVLGFGLYWVNEGKKEDKVKIKKR